MAGGIVAMFVPKSLEDEQGIFTVFIALVFVGIIVYQLLG